MPLPSEAAKITSEKSLGCIPKASMFPEKDIDIREGFEERFNILVERANTRVEYRTGF